MIKLDDIKTKVHTAITFIQNNFKTILIVLLSIFLITSFLYKPKVDKSYLTKIKALELKNDSTFRVNDSLKKANYVLQAEANHIQDSILKNVGVIKKRDSIIYVYNKKKNETNNFVNSLTSDSVAGQLTDYLKRHR